MMGTTECADIVLASDNIVEGDESFFLEFQNNDRFLVVDSDRDLATVVITDLTSMILVYTLVESLLTLFLHIHRS